MSIAEMIERNLQASAGEVLLLTRGEYDSFGVVAVVRVCREINLRLLADAFLVQERIGMESPSRMFNSSDFVDFLELQGAIERIQVRSVHVADDFDCAIATPRKGWAPIEELEPLPYEWAESVYDPRCRS